MEFSQIKEKDLYYAVTEGQFIGVFYILKKTSTGGKMIGSYYGGGTMIDYFDKLDFDWEIETDEDEDLPDKSFLANTQHIKRFRFQDQIVEYLKNILKFVFEEGIRR